MKNLFCFYFISTLLYYCNAQTSIYHPFPESDAVWNYNSLDLCQVAHPPHFRYSQVISGDTTLNSQLYHKLYVPFVLLNYELINCDKMVSGYIGAIRQEVMDRIVKIIPPGENSELLLYDFNLSTGDTVKGYLQRFNNYEPDIVHSIDSILVSGSYRKRWNIDTFGHVSIIEGIGSTYVLNGAPLGCQTDDIVYNLSCFSQDGQTLYPDSNENCEIISSIENLNEKPINIYPNPSNGTFYIHNYHNPYSKFDLEIVNLNGQIVGKKEYKGDENNPVFSFDIPDGLYFIRIMEGGVFKKVEKLVIKH